jgi:hypothetical protein
MEEVPDQINKAIDKHLKETESYEILEMVKELDQKIEQVHNIYEDLSVNYSEVISKFKLDKFDSDILESLYILKKELNDAVYG